MTPRSRDIHESQMSDGDCPICGIAIRKHDRCSVCSILVGDKHYEKVLYPVGDELRCSNCAKRGKGQ